LYPVSKGVKDEEISHPKFPRLGTEICYPAKKNIEIRDLSAFLRFVEIL